MHSVIVVGGGFAGAYCARALETKSKPGDLHLTLINPRNFLVFTPLLVEAGTGSLEPRHCVVPLRSFLKRGSSFHMGEVTSVDFARSTLECRTPGWGEPQTLEFDDLVLAPGSVTSLPPVPGLEEHAYTMKSMGDAVELRDRAVSMLEAAEVEPDAERRKALLHFVVVGANYSGVEVAGEYEAFLRRASRGYRNVEAGDIRVTLVEKDKRILGAMDESLARYAQGELGGRGVDVRLESTLEKIGPRESVLEGGEVLDACTVVWCAGIAPSPLIRKLKLPEANGGYIDCEPDGRVKGHDRVWAIGDAAVNPDAEGGPYPPTAQHAVRQGPRVAENILRRRRGEETRPIEYKPLGELAGLGCRSGVATVFGFRISGFWAWWLYRSVYLLKMPGFSRKVRVALDWTIDLIFRPDVVQLGVHRHEDS